jgi:alpha-N-acetylglucosaminidase
VKLSNGTFSADYDSRLSQYSYRLWAGLLRSFYLPRWRIYTDAVLAALASSPFKPINDGVVQEALKEFEEGWVADVGNNSTRMGTVTVGSSTAIALELAQKYGAARTILK